MSVRFCPRMPLAASALFACVVAVSFAQQRGRLAGLAYDDQTRGPVPIPVSERGLQTVVAEPWFNVTKQRMVLEGPCFDRSNNLLFSEASGSRVLRLTPEKRLSTVSARTNSG